MRRFIEYFGLEARCCAILDIGGTPAIWSQIDLGGLDITLLNLDFPSGAASSEAHLKFIVGNALALPFRSEEFDIAFSNSVIEHVGGWEEQKTFAAEARRVAAHLWVQTPARAFPIEPHFISLGLHYLPRRWQSRLLRYMSLWGWMVKPEQTTIDHALGGIELLTKKQMQKLFPDCTILTERFCLLPKSYIAVR